MKTQEKFAQETTCNQPLIKRIFRGCNRFLGPFLFIFFMSYNLLLSIGVDPSARNLLPYFVIPSCFVCVTIGASCWFGDNVRQWRSYCISSVITFVLYFYIFMVSNYTNCPQTIPQGMIILSLTVVSTVYSIWKLRKAKKINRETTVSNTERQSSKRNLVLAKTVRLISLISFCSVFLENAQHFLRFLFVGAARSIRMFMEYNVVEVIVAAYALWLIICFARKEFVQLGEHAKCEEENSRTDAQKNI